MQSEYRTQQNANILDVSHFQNYRFQGEPPGTLFFMRYYTLLIERLQHHTEEFFLQTKHKSKSPSVNQLTKYSLQKIQ